MPLGPAEGFREVHVRINESGDDKTTACIDNEIG